MIANLQPYPKYKDSGSRWLAAVPTHWEVRNLRTLIRHRNERNRADLPLLSVAREKGVFVRSLTDENENHNVIPDDLSNYKVARAGNLVINKMKAWQGSMGIAPCDGIVSPAYFVFDFAISNRAFGQALLRSKPYVAHFGQASDGVRVGQWDLTIPGMRQIPVLVPPPEEQAAVVRFLDYANGRLERAIRAKRQVIALLHEQKQAIIHRAVTRGLDPTVLLKPSGIPWLGDIPKHWGICSVKRLCRSGYKTFTDGDWIEIPFITESGVRLLQTGNVGRGHYREKGFRFISEETFKSFGCTEVFPNDVLICRLDGPVGRACLAPQLGVRMITSVDNTILKVRPDVDAQFVVSLMSSSAWLNFLQSICRAGGGFRYRVSRSMLGAISVPLPPHAEQQAIVRGIEAESAPANAAIARLEREISLLREYRTRLVADVVTGKLDVRPAARQLPEEGGELSDGAGESDSSDLPDEMPLE